MHAPQYGVNVGNPDGYLTSLGDPPVKGFGSLTPDDVKAA